MADMAGTNFFNLISEWAQSKVQSAENNLNPHLASINRWAKDHNDYYESLAKSWFRDRGLVVPRNPDDFKHALAAADGPYKLAREFGIPLSVARVATMMLGDANELYAEHQRREQGDEHYKDLSNNVAGRFTDQI